MIDLFSHQLVGCSYETQLVNDSLRMAIWKHKPHKSLLWHTDRGSQYASENHRYLLKQHGIQQSMSQKGNCWDNAVSESFFFHTLKTELIHHQTFHARQEAKCCVEYIEVFLQPRALNIQLLDIYHPLTSSCSNMLLSFVSRYVLIHQHHEAT